MLRSAQPRDHIVQLYTDEAILSRAVTEFIGTGLLAGEACAAVTTPGHRRALEERLGVRLDVTAAHSRHQLIVLDAETSLADLLVDGRPDREKFFTLVLALLERARRAGNGRVRLFGEMVNLLG